MIIWTGVFGGTKKNFERILIFFKKALDKFRLSWYNNLVECGGIAQLARALGSYPGCHWFESDCRYHRPVGQEVKTSPFHGGIMGSIPVRVTISTAHIWLNKAFCGLFFLPRNRRWVLFGIRQLIPRLYKYPEKCYNNHKVQRSPRKSRDSVEQDGS